VQANSYIVRIELDERDAHSKVEGFRPTPGMPADVYIKTGRRTFVEYLLRPLLDSLSRGFANRETFAPRLKLRSRRLSGNSDV
jgi:hypothetical protein